MGRQPFQWLLGFFTHQLFCQSCLSSLSWAPLLTLSLLCSAARQQCCQYYQYIYGQHYSYPDPASCVQNLTYANASSSRMLYLGDGNKACHSVSPYSGINQVVKLSSKNKLSPQMQPCSCHSYGIPLFFWRKKKEKEKNKFNKMKTSSPHPTVYVK